MPPQAASPEQRLRELGIELPPPPRPIAVYVPAVRTGNLLFTAGHTPRQPDGTAMPGKLGADLSIEEGHAAARVAGLNLLSTVRNTLGSLDAVVRLVKTLGMVNCTPDFGRQPQVVNGFSELMVEIFGEERGKGGRSAVGMASLPGNQPVEIEAIFEVRG
jgi:enamine deaminase RidA (YjgF/YER057c/UK114 family)